MAVEDTTNPPRSPLLDYPQVIIAAIEGLNEKEGSTESAISKYIESNFPDLSAAHATLLSNTLEKMKLTGQLIFVNNGYHKPGSDAPLKRGRGRPPKPKDPLQPGVVPGPSRPRGRPPKPRDPLAPPAQPKKKTGPSSGRPRGRPRKYPAVAPVTAPVGVKKARGRPPKVTA